MAWVHRESRRVRDERRRDQQVNQLRRELALVKLSSCARMKRRHEWKMVGRELKETWRGAQDLDGSRHGAREDGNAGGGRTIRSGRKRCGVGGATNDKNLPKLGGAGKRLEGARWQLEQGVSQPRRKKIFS